jgi:hypothetical protein
MGADASSEGDVALVDVAALQERLRARGAAV